MKVSAKSKSIPVSDDNLLTVAEVAKMLRVKPSWLYERTRDRSVSQIPHVRVGRYVRFERNEIVEFIRSQRKGYVGPRRASR